MTEPRGGGPAEPRGGVPAEEPPVCSSKGCRAEARWVLAWRNPRIHGSEREKAWVACDEHRPTLGQFLDARGFLLRVEPLDGE